MVEQEEDVQKPTEVAASWLKRIDAARGEEKDWREDVKKIWGVYAPAEKEEAPAYNILFSNTEILLPSLYSNQPQPDVRRRYGDKDPIAKIVSKGIERVIEYELGEYDFDHEAECSVLDGLITGRGLLRVKYVPEFGMTGMGEQSLVHEAVHCEYVKWEDFARSAGKVWNDVTWIAFRGRLTKKEAEAKFGAEIVSKLKFDFIANVVDDKRVDDETEKQDKRLTVWEVWDKTERKIYYFADCYKEGPLLVEDDNLRLKQFFPIPRPLQFILKTNSLIPTPDYKQYEKQAIELSEISRRIIKITQILKIRGVYDSTVVELSNLFNQPDNYLMPADNVPSFYEKGGLEKMIWLMPIQEAANVLRHLYDLREAAKAVIYEISGISDIMRGATKASETLGAQQIKSQYADTRLKRRQKEVQRFLRDIIRLKAEIIAEHFQPESILKIANLDIASLVGPEAAQNPQMMQAKEQEILALLRDETLRNYRIDVETDSTLAFSDKDSQEQVAAFLQAINQFFAMVGPLVEKGVLPMEAVKIMLTTVSSKFKMGEQFEDALDGLQSPPPDDTKQKEIEQENKRLEIENKKIDADIEQGQMEVALKSAQMGLDAHENTKNRQTAAESF